MTSFLFLLIGLVVGFVIGLVVGVAWGATFVFNSLANRQREIPERPSRK